MISSVLIEKPFSHKPFICIAKKKLVLLHRQLTSLASTGRSICTFRTSTVAFSMPSVASQLFKGSDFHLNIHAPNSHLILSKTTQIYLGKRPCHVFIFILLQVLLVQSYGTSYWIIGYQCDECLWVSVTPSMHMGKGYGMCSQFYQHEPDVNIIIFAISQLGYLSTFLATC